MSDFFVRFQLETDGVELGAVTRELRSRLGDVHDERVVDVIAKPGGDGKGTIDIVIVTSADDRQAAARLVNSALRDSASSSAAGLRKQAPLQGQWPSWLKPTGYTVRSTTRNNGKLFARSLGDGAYARGAVSIPVPAAEVEASARPTIGHPAQPGF